MWAVAKPLAIAPVTVPSHCFSSRFNSIQYSMMEFDTLQWHSTTCSLDTTNRNCYVEWEDTAPSLTGGSYYRHFCLPVSKSSRLWQYKQQLLNPMYINQKDRNRTSYKRSYNIYIRYFKLSLSPFLY